MTGPILPTDDTARDIARNLLRGARHAALGTLTPGGEPMVTRIALGLCPEDQPLTLISDLAAHSAALRANPACSLLIGEPGPRGDPLTHPRLTLQARAAFVNRDGPDHAEMAAHWLRDHPKAKLYAGFADFRFVRFRIARGHLNGGFGRAFSLDAADLDPSR